MTDLDPTPKLQAPLGLLPESRFLPRWISPVIRRLSGISTLEARAAGLNFDLPAPQFALEGLGRLGVRFALSAAELERVPASGPVVIVANHPFGGLDGMIAIAALADRRPDLKLLANGILGRLAPLAPMILAVDPFGGARAARSNSAPVRHAIRHVQGGGALLLFPAGEVSSIDLKRGCVTDPAWSQAAARIVSLSAAPVVPMYFAGRNSNLFQAVGLIHPRLRTLLLPRELLKKSGKTIVVRMGVPIKAARIKSLTDRDTLATHLRASVYALAGADTPSRVSPAAPNAQPKLAPLIVAVTSHRLASEIAQLPASQKLAEIGPLHAYYGSAEQLPWVLQEIGRLRETTFRAVGEGTGRAADIDVFDQYYEHLFVWHQQEQHIVGAYRIGRVDEIRRRFGVRGLYLHTLFEFREPFFALLGPALELGRSFVRPEYQRSFAPLMLLWKGICEYIGRHPRYVRLIGPASVSNEYDPVSRSLLVQVLKATRNEPMLATLVRARSPFRPRYSLRSLFGRRELLPDLEQLGSLIEDNEPDGKGVPVLLRQYLKLGARTIGFNIDAAFGEALDCLIYLDVRRVPMNMLQKYMTPSTLERFRQYWKLRDPQVEREVG